KLAENQSPAQTRGGGATLVVDERDKKRAAMIDGLLLRSGFSGLDPKFKPEGVNEFRNMSLLDLAKECCDTAGIKHRGMTNREIAQAAMYDQVRASSGALGTSDFTYIMANTVNRTLRQAYDLAPRTFMPFCRAATI